MSSYKWISDQKSSLVIPIMKLEFIKRYEYIFFNSNFCLNKLISSNHMTSQLVSMLRYTLLYNFDLYILLRSILTPIYCFTRNYIFRPKTSRTNLCQSVPFDVVALSDCQEFMVARGYGKISFWCLLGCKWDKVGLIPPHLRFYPLSKLHRPTNPPAALFDITL